MDEGLMYYHILVEREMKKLNAEITEGDIDTIDSYYYDKHTPKQCAEAIVDRYK